MTSVTPFTTEKHSVQILRSKSITINSPKRKSKPSDSRLYWKTNCMEFAQNVSVTGMQYAANPEEPVFRRVLWSILILAGAGFMCYQVYIQTSQYARYDVQTEMREVFPPSLPFPAVTICPENRVVRSKAQAAGILDLVEDLHPPYRDIKTPVPDLTRYNTTSLSSNWTQTYINTSVTVDDVLHMCYFKAVCNSSWFKTVYTNAGVCIQVDTEKQRMTIERPGSTYGLVMLLYANHSETAALLAYSSGFRLIVHEPDEFPDISTAVLIKPGDLSFLQIEKRQLIQAPAVCSIDNNRKLEYFERYTRGNCHAECDSKIIQSRCGCRMFGLPGSNDLPVCDPIQHTTCAEIVLFTQGFNSEDCNCPEECDVTKYRVSISSSLLADHFIEHIVHNSSQFNLSTEDVQKGFCPIIIYFPSLSYTKLTSTRSYTVIDLFCDMGGALGLLLGSTFFTLYEFIDFFIWAAWKKRTRKS